MLARGASVSAWTSGRDSNRGWETCPKKTPAPKPVGPGSRRYLALQNRPLGLNDPRSDEENQFLVRGGNRAALEQVTQQRHIAEQRHLAHIDGVVGLDDATNHHRSAIGHQHLRGGLLCNQGGVALNGPTEVRGRVL